MGSQSQGGELPKAEVRCLILESEVQMKEAAGNLELEQAALLRD